MPEAVRPGAIRPGTSAPQHIAEHYQPVVAPVADSVAQPARPGAMRPGASDAFGVNDSSFAGVVDLPDAARPGAIRPGEDRQLVPPEPEPVPGFEVPAVVDRPLEIDDGEKVVVTSFAIDGVQDRPEFEITQADVEAIAAAKLAERPDGFTVGRLQEVADDITSYYREHGLILAQAFVPVQEVRDGVITIQVMEGLLGRVVTEGNEIYAAEVLQTPFEPLIGRPVTKEAIESALLNVSDYPGQSSFGVFQPGIEVGTADMVIKVQEEKRLELALRGDNHGIRETGRNRYLGQLNWNNPLGQGDRLSTTLQYTEAPDNTFYYAFDYSVPVDGFFNTVFTIGTSRNQFDVAGEFRASNIASDIRNHYMSLRKDIVRSRLANLSAGVKMAMKKSDTKANSRRVTVDRLSVLSFDLTFDHVDARFGGLNTGYIEISHGFNDVLGAMGDAPFPVPPSRQNRSGDFAEAKFDKVFLNLSRFQALTPIWDKLNHHNLLFNFEVMWSPDTLTPLEQYSVGGPTNVRAYRPTQDLFDRAVFGSVEWIINAPFIAEQPAFGNRTWGELMQLSFFYDMAAGKLNSALPTDVASENYKGVGFALSFNNPNVFSGKITVSSPIGLPEPEDDKEPQYWVDLNFFF